ncbi:MAG TPA: hypothetical protein PLO90_00185 [Clostridia bacterium]|nr:hypothetical protein [Clostridia bacterium]HPY42771.1 hypothetical protein [Clostridia bacterium]HQA97422.1 hypothetical protein [Clostridia bacterium]HQO54744.1 hypothetical protein [Clostridia bacterium]
MQANKIPRHFGCKQALHQYQKETAPENKYFLKKINIFAIIVIVLISLSIARGYDNVSNKINLDVLKIILSIIWYFLTVFIIVCLNYLNRTDDTQNAITDNLEEDIIRDSTLSEIEGIEL